MKFKSLFSLILLYFSVSGCATLQELATIEKPSLAVTNFQFESISLESVNMLFDIEVDNPNPMAVSTTSYAFDLDIAGNNFISANQPLETEIGATQKSVIEVPVSLGFNELFDTFNAIKDQDETDFAFAGNVGIEVPVLGFIEVPFNYDGNIPVVKVPEVSLGKLSVRSLSLSGAALDVVVNINNPNSFGIDLNSLAYNVDINGLSSLSGNIEEQVSIASKGENSVTIPLEVNLLQLGLGVYQKISNKEPFTYSLSGDTNLGANLPFFNPSSFSFDKSGTVNILD